MLAATARRHVVRDFPGPLSIKTVTRGRVAWRVERRDVWVDESSFLVLNDGEPYSMNIEALEPVTTCCVFFQPGFVESVFRDLSTSDHQRLDDPCFGGQYSDQSRTLFLSRLRPRSPRLTAKMGELRACLGSADSDTRLQELYLELAAELLVEADETRVQLASIRATRPSTRAELLARVSRGREYLHAACDAPATLARAAQAAAMSPFHFHRTFRQAFGKTPSRYLAELRFTRAAALLRSGRSVTETALEVGFSGTSAFSTAFRRFYGVQPIQFAAPFRKNAKALRS